MTSSLPRQHTRSGAAELASHGVTGLPDIVRADPSETLALADLVARAFYLLPPSVWLVPAEHADHRVDVMRDFFAIGIEHAFTHGTVETLSDRSAVAVWFDYTRDVPAPANYEVRRLAACGHWHERFIVLDDLFTQHHPHEPHWYLPLIAVDPARQHTGRGTALLRHRLASLDAAHHAAYLEAASAPLVGYYQRFGYNPGPAFHLPTYFDRDVTGPPFIPMWRPPRPAAN